MSLRTPLSRATGRGSAGEGVSHWWVQRVTAVALIPLVVWFTLALLTLPLNSFHAVREWLAQPHVAVLTLLLIIALGWHSKLGVQVVVEDYVHAEGAKTALLLLSVFAHVGAAVAAALAILRISLS